MSWYQKGKTNLDFTEARDSEWQWHQLGDMQVCTSLQTDNHASTLPLSFLQAGCPSSWQCVAVLCIFAKYSNYINDRCGRQLAQYCVEKALKSVEFDDDVELLLSLAGFVMGPHVTSESKIRGTDSAALRTSWTCLRLCGSCVTGCTSFFRGSDPAI